MESANVNNFLQFGNSIKPKRKPEDYAKIRMIVMKQMTTPTIFTSTKFLK